MIHLTWVKVGPTPAREQLGQRVADPFGHRWSIMTLNPDFTPEDMQSEGRPMARTNPVERLRKICLAFPEAEEKVFGGHTTPTYRVRDKIFVMESGGDDRPAFWCKAPPGAQRILVGSDPDRFFAPPYVGPKGWIGMYLDGTIDWHLVAELVTDSYRMTAPKRLLPLLDNR